MREEGSKRRSWDGWNEPGLQNTVYSSDSHTGHRSVCACSLHYQHQPDVITTVIHLSKQYEPGVCSTLIPSVRWIIAASRPIALLGRGHWVCFIMWTWPSTQHHNTTFRHLYRHRLQVCMNFLKSSVARRFGFSRFGFSAQANDFLSIGWMHIVLPPIQWG